MMLLDLPVPMACLGAGNSTLETALQGIPCLFVPSSQHEQVFVLGTNKILNKIGTRAKPEPSYHLHNRHLL
ncbi:hypothetical protein Trco_007286 [Trichoderma cornu-damae]|uniref:Uncharacterized protein n=1 Tax=Trichoderma cornu-damae TaxID=654480 RepID=A0A9P8QJ18_9HYPO|nr:hypothetical protein Trco_007286 [Trichoderma cornu-damae]